MSYVVPLGGVNRGKVGRMNGDFLERSRALGKCGRVAVYFVDRDFPKDCTIMLLTNLRKATELEKILAGVVHG